MSAGACADGARAVRPLVEIQIAKPRRDVSGIEEDGGVNVRHHGDASLGVDDGQVAIVKAVVGIASQRVVPPRLGWR